MNTSIRLAFAAAVTASLSFGTSQAVASSMDYRICTNCCTSHEYCRGRCEQAGYADGYCYHGDCYCTS